MSLHDSLFHFLICYIYFKSKLEGGIECHNPPIIYRFLLIVREGLENYWKFINVIHGLLLTSTNIQLYPPPPPPHNIESLSTSFLWMFPILLKFTLPKISFSKRICGFLIKQKLFLEQKIYIYKKIHLKTCWYICSI